MDPERARSIDPAPHGSSDDPDVLDFSQNVNPDSPDGTQAVYENTFAAADTYPPEPPTAFREAAARYVDCQRKQIVPTPGGLAAIRQAISLAIDSGDRALIPAPSFGEYAREVRLHGGTPTFVAPPAVLETPPDPFAIVIVCQPNNPTGQVLDVDALRRYIDRCRAAGTWVLVDEAFLGFTNSETIAGTPGAVVVRSLTKLFGLPGLRAGFAVATDDKRAALQGARRPWNVGTPALAVGTHCLGASTFIRETRARVRDERARIRTALAAHFEVAASDAPFLLVDVGDREADNVLSEARARGIVLRDARTFRGLDNHVRVAVRRPAENDRLIEVLTAL